LITWLLIAWLLIAWLLLIARLLIALLISRLLARTTISARVGLVTRLIAGLLIAIGTPHPAARIRLDRLIAWDRRPPITAGRRQLVGLDVLRIATPILRVWHPTISGRRVIGRRLVLHLNRGRRRRRLHAWNRQRQKLGESWRPCQPKQHRCNGGNRA